MVFKIVWDGVVREIVVCCCCISEDVVRLMKLFGNFFVVRFSIDVVINFEWLVFWIIMGEERIIFGGDDMVIWVRVGEMVDDWIGSEIVVVVIIEFGRWVNIWFFGFFFGDEVVLLRKEVNGCFGGVVCWEWSSFDVFVCFWDIIMFVKFNIVIVGFDWRLFNNGGDFIIIVGFWVVFFWVRFNLAIIDIVWGFCLGVDLFIVVFFILVILVVVAIGLCIGMIVDGVVIVGLIFSLFDCIRVLKIDKFMVVVVNEVEIVGIVVGVVVVRLFSVVIINGVIFVMFFILVMLIF